MPGLVPGIHVWAVSIEDVDGRDLPARSQASLPRRQASPAMTAG
jgi:hypothetical protein